MPTSPGGPPPGALSFANDGVLPLAVNVSKVAVIGPAADDRRLLQGDYHYPAHQELLLGPAELADAQRAVFGGWPVEGRRRRAARPRRSGRRNGAGSGIPDVFFLPSGEGALKPGRVLHRARHSSGRAQGCSGRPGRSDLREGLRASWATTAPASPQRSRRRRKPTSPWWCWAAAPGCTRAQPSAKPETPRTSVDGRPGGTSDSRGGHRHPHGARRHERAGPCLSDVADHVQALLVAWPLGEQGGNALADVLLGSAEPTGRLAVTLPRATGQVPLYSSHRSGGGAFRVLRRLHRLRHTPLFSFGHGLGYTTFGYSDMTVEAGDTSSPIIVGVTVTNTGDREGEEVVQLYVSDLVASVARPRSFLIGFTR